MDKITDLLSKREYAYILKWYIGNLVISLRKFNSISLVVFTLLTNTQTPLYFYIAHLTH